MMKGMPMHEGKRKQESGIGSEREVNKLERRECEHKMNVAEHLRKSDAFRSSVLETSATRELTILKNGIAHAHKYLLLF